MASLADVYVTLLVETSRVSKQIEDALRNVDARRIGQELGRELQQGVEDVTVDVDADTKAAEVKLDKLTRDRKVEVKVDLDAGGAALSSLATGAADAGAKAGTSFMSALSGSLSTSGPALPALAVGLTPMILAAGGAAATLTGLLGPLSAAAAGLAPVMGVLGLATQNVGDAMGAAVSGDTEKLAEALTKLSPAAQQATLAVQSIWEQGIKPLQTQLSEALFADLAPALVDTVNTILPAIQPGLVSIAGAFNTMFQNLGTVLQDPAVVGSLQTFVDNIGTALMNLAPAIGPLVTAFSKIVEVGSGFLPGIADSIVSLATAFGDWITSAADSGELQQWMQSALDMLGQMAPLVPSIVSMFMAMGPVAQRLVPVFVGLVTAATPFINAVLIPMLGHLGGMETIMRAMTSAFEIGAGVVRALGSAFDWAKQFVVGAWEYVKRFTEYITTVLQPVLAPLQHAFEVVWGAIGNAIKWAYDNAIKPIMDKIGQAFDWVVDKINDLIGAYNSIPLLPDLPTISAPSSSPPSGSPNDPDAFTNLPATTPQGPVQSPPGGNYQVPQPIPETPGGAPLPGTPGNVPTGAVPVVEVSPGVWTSTNAAWAHLIQRESGGRNIRQGITDANSGGNEAEGIFQITPATWRANGGGEFATSPIKASPQQQAIVAARIFNRNPSGSDWGAGLPGREKASDLASGIGTIAAPTLATPGGTPTYTGPHDSRLQLSGTGNEGTSVSLTPSGQLVGEQLLQMFPAIKNIGTVRPDALKWHPSGRGLDVMIDNKAEGDRIHAYLEANKELLGIANTLWQVKDHFDHIHIGMKEGVSPALQQLAQGNLEGNNYTESNPLAVRETDPLNMAELGRNFVTGAMEVFGLGDVFADPTQFGLAKIFRSIMGLKPGGEGSDATSTDSGLLDAFIPGGGGNGSLVDFATNMIPDIGGNGTVNNHNLNVNVAGNADGDAMNYVDNYFLSNTRNLPH